MRRAFLPGLFAIVLFFLFAVPASAEDGFLSGLPEEVGESVRDLIPPGLVTDTETLGEALSPDGILRILSDGVREASGDAVSLFSFLLGLTVLSLSLFALLPEGETGDTVRFAVFSTVCAATAGRVIGAVSETVGATQTALRTFSGAVPLMCAVSALAGGERTAAVEASVMGTSVGVCELFLSDWLIPCLSVLGAATLLGSVSGDGRFEKIAASVRKIFLRGIGIVSAVLSAVLALQTVIAGAQDGAAVRAAKYAGGMIPVVGSSVSGALSTVIGGIRAVSATVGVGVVYAILAALVPVLIRLFLLRAAVGIPAAFADFCHPGGVGRVFSGFSGLFDALIGVCALSGILCILETLIFIGSGGNLV